MNDKPIKDLVEAFLSLTTYDECCDFLEDLCTVNEIRSMAQRLEVARLLKDNAVYTEIAEKTGTSTATISRVNRALSYGADGYKNVLERN